MSKPLGENLSTASEPQASLSKAQNGDEVPDPDEDDLDDLDELLDEFSPSKSKVPQQSAPAKSPLQHGSTDDGNPSTAAADDFTKQLQAQMAALMGNGDESPEMQKEIEAVLHELGATADPTSNMEPSKAVNHAVPPTATHGSFQETIRKTMQRMQTSGDKADAAAVAGEDASDILSNILKELQIGDANGAAGDEAFSNMLMTMMENLTNKDILYDPMKELNDKFPLWMSKHKAGVKADDLVRYQKQQRLVAEIVAKFEESTYSDDHTDDRQYIVERMQEMQAAGSPPVDLVGDMSGTQEALQDINTGCPQQ
ncbi:MAG: hypothetical protein Q9201_005142 [Fulgogasparrea decipioides]